MEKCRKSEEKKTSKKGENSLNPEKRRMSYYVRVKIMQCGAWKNCSSCHDEVQRLETLKKGKKELFICTKWNRKCRKKYEMKTNEMLNTRKEEKDERDRKKWKSFVSTKLKLFFSSIRFCANEFRNWWHRRSFAWCKTIAFNVTSHSMTRFVGRIFMFFLLLFFRFMVAKKKNSGKSCCTFRIFFAPRHCDANTFEQRQRQHQ